MRETEQIYVRPAGTFIVDADRWSNSMWHNAAVFLATALVAAIFGFTGVAGMPSIYGRVACAIFVALAIVSLVIARRRPS